MIEIFRYHATAFFIWLSYVRGFIMISRIKAATYIFVSLKLGQNFFCYNIFLQAGIINSKLSNYEITARRRDFVKQQHTFLLLLTLGLGAVIGTLNITMFNVALPTMMTYFDAPLATVQWLTSGYMLAAGMIIPAAGFLGDRFGYKRIFLFGTLLRFSALYCRCVGLVY